MTPPDGWTLTGDRLRREFVFGDFAEAFAFMTRVALVAQRRDHHPDWSNSWNRVVIELTSHDAASSVTDRDVKMALAINALVP